MRQENIQIHTKDKNPVFTDDPFSTTPNILKLISYSIKDLLYWWYIQMPIIHLQKLSRISLVASDQLSIPILFQNFFLPWKRHKSLVGYFIGITLKLLYLPIAILIYVLMMLSYITFMLLWLLIPLVAIFFTIISLFLD